MEKKDPEMGRFRCTGKWWGSEAWIENWKPAEGRVSNQHQKKLHSTVQNFKSINGLYGSTPSNAKIIIFPFLLAENPTFSGLLAMRALRGKKIYGKVFVMDRQHIDFEVEKWPIWPRSSFECRCCPNGIFSPRIFGLEKRLLPSYLEWKHNLFIFATPYWHVLGELQMSFYIWQSSTLLF